ncbi:tetratricopeptide repeat-containing sensor histidine kinase [Xanthocytophaga flava]|uniref:tetratricopeptide repeat-containing sensor histidine kinase n=1 Tax=Xanthocytophaga flava TaxID=3048013 RepID=UPI0028D21CD1|nr:sensor histidine kinase [Xanthocytophaga flavus]MDJ1472782.1 sensor histidine kinase [Xanthocytophaga flavus]
MFKKLFLLVIYSIIPVQVFSQVVYSLGDEKAYISQLEQQTQQAQSDSMRAAAYFRLSLFYRRINDLQKANDAYQKGARLGQKYPFLKAASSYYQTISQFATTDIFTLEKNIRKADSLLQPFKNAEAYKLRGVLWHTYGIIQQIKGDEKGAMDAFVNKAVPYSQQSGDGIVLGKAYKGIGIIFMNLDQRDKAASYLQQSIQSEEKAFSDNPLREVELVETYITAGENYVYLKQYKAAKEVLDKAQAILTQHPASNLYLIYYYAEGIYFDHLNQHQRAIDSFDKGITLSKYLSAVHALNRLFHAKYKALSNQKEYKKAVLVLNELIENPALLIQDRKLYYKEMYTTYAQLNDTQKAYQWAKQYIILSDSLYETKFQKDIVELETKYKNAENEKKIAVLQAAKEKSALESKNQRLLTGLLGASSLVLLSTALFALVLYRNSRKLSQQKELNYQQQLKETKQTQQIQLTQALMQGEEKERKRLATDLHDGLGGMLAGIKINLSRIAGNDGRSGSELDKILNQLDVSTNELRRIARNMMPESLLQLGLESALRDMCDSMTTDKTQISFEAFDIDTKLPKETQVNIYRIVQELLTNSIKHANASEIIVQCSQNESIFFITLEDNGQGFDPVAKGQKSGIGLTNIQNRVEYLKGKLDISSALSEGTTINIEFDVAY